MRAKTTIEKERDRLELALIVLEANLKKPQDSIDISLENSGTDFHERLKILNEANTRYKNAKQHLRVLNWVLGGKHFDYYRAFKMMLQSKGNNQ